MIHGNIRQERKAYKKKLIEEILGDENLDKAIQGDKISIKYKKVVLIYAA